jgi:hypothetical protein
MSPRPYTPLYFTYLDALEKLDDAERGRLFTAMLTYGRDGVEPDLPGNEQFVWPLIRAQIDRDEEAYNQKSKSASKSINTRWQKEPEKKGPADTNVYERIRTYPENTNVYERIQEEEKEEGKEKKEEAQKNNPPLSPLGGKLDQTAGREKGSRRFIAPTVEEVSAYCRERKNRVDPERFVNFYTSKGWVVGKTPMKDWKAAVRNWERDGPDIKYQSGERKKSKYAEVEVNILEGG